MQVKSQLGPKKDRAVAPMVLSTFTESWFKLKKPAGPQRKKAPSLTKEAKMEKFIFDTHQIFQDTLY